VKVPKLLNTTSTPKSHHYPLFGHYWLRMNRPKETKQSLLEISSFSIALLLKNINKVCAE